MVDCNAWFVDPQYSFKKTKLRLSEIAYFVLVLDTLRRGFNHWVGATNEKYKASRWSELTGSSPQGMLFTHPEVKDPHKLLLVHPFDYHWLYKCFEKYGTLYRLRMDIRPSRELSGENSLKDGELYSLVERSAKMQFADIGEDSLVMADAVSL